MSLEFEKVDDILTEETIYTMNKNFTNYSDQIKSNAMDLVYRSQNYGYETDARMFDDITAISFALDAMIDTLREYQDSYAALLGKYKELVKAE
jgi:hypothetical protein